MKTLLVYYSLTQNNEMLAKMLQKQLDCDIFKIETLRKKSNFWIVLDRLLGRKPSIKKHNLSLKDYDHFVFVAPIWLGQLASPLKTFLYQERKAIKSYSFITLCGGLEGQKEIVEAELISILRQGPANFTDLWISAIVDKSVPKDANTISAYRMGTEEIEKFRTKIDEFCFNIHKKKILEPEAS